MLSVLKWLSIIAAFSAIGALISVCKTRLPLGFSTDKEHVINIFDKTGQPTLAELRAWHFSDGSISCYIFLQKQTGQAWVPSASCLPAWLIW